MGEPRVATLRLDDGTIHRWCVWCPACQKPHYVDSGWHYNGDHEKPSFLPSILTGAWGREGEVRCHSFVTDGVIHFCGDSEHAMKNQSVELPPFPFSDDDSIHCLPW